MIIQCDKCATRFRLDDSRVNPNGVKVRCTKCDNVFIVTPAPQPDEADIEELFGAATTGAPQAPAVSPDAPQAPKHQAPKRNDQLLSFDFDREVTKEDIFKAPDDSADAFATGVGFPAETDEPAKKFSLDDLDFSFTEDRSDVKKSPAAPEDAGEPAAPDKGDDAEVDDYRVDLGLEGEKDDPSDTDLDFSFGDLTGGKNDEPQTEAGPEPEPEQEQEPEPESPAPSPEKVIPFQAAAYTRDGNPPEAPKAEDADDDIEEERAEPFKFVLSKTMDDDERLSFSGPDDEADGREEDEDMADLPSRQAQPRMALVIAALIIILGGGLIYFTGVIDRLAGLIMPPSSSALKVVEIEAIKGFYEQNRNFGRVFVIDARVKNITDEPQEIKAATGVIYNNDGDRLAEKSVSPGRIVTLDDVRSLQREELERAFRDPSGGVIPAKGSVPVMVLFFEVPDGLSEFGVDIVR